MAYGAEFTCNLVNFKNGNAVVSPVGTVEKSSRRMDVHIGGIAGAGEILGKGRNRLNLIQPATSFVVGESGNGGVEFIDDVRMSAVGMKIEVAWSRSGFNCCKWRGVWNQLPLGKVEPITHDFIKPQIRRKGITISRVSYNRNERVVLPVAGD